MPPGPDAPAPTIIVDASEGSSRPLRWRAGGSAGWNAGARLPLRRAAGRLVDEAASALEPCACAGRRGGMLGRPAVRRREWTGNPSPPSWPRCTCSMRARCCAWSTRSRRREDRRGCASPCSSGSTPRRPATTWRSTPRRSRRRWKPRARACRRAWRSSGRPAAGPRLADRRERVRGRPQRRHHRRLRGVRERAVPADRVQAAHGQGARAAAPARAAVHQQVLHPRPAARELADPPRGRPGAPRVRRQLAQRRATRSPSAPGTTTSSTPRSAPSSWCRRSPARTRSTRSASASAAPSSPPRWRCWRRAASSRRRA